MENTEKGGGGSSTINIDSTARPLRCTQISDQGPCSSTIDQHPRSVTTAVRTYLATEVQKPDFVRERLDPAVDEGQEMCSRIILCTGEQVSVIIRQPVEVNVGRERETRERALRLAATQQSTTL